MKQLLLIIAVAMLVVGCSQRPTTQILKTQQALQEAKYVQAHKNAPEETKSALATLRLAIIEQETQDEKFAMFRSYSRCRDLYIQAEIELKTAIVRSNNTHTDESSLSNDMSDLDQKLSTSVGDSFYEDSL